MDIPAAGPGEGWVNLSQGYKNSYFKNRARISFIFGVEAAILLLKIHQRKWGASPPHLR